MPGQVNIAVIGLGRIGRLHAENLAHRIPQAKLVAISDLNPETLNRCAADFGVSVALQDHRALLNQPEIDAVAICSNTDTHAQIIAEAAAAGKHIFCEKPIDLDLSRIDRALAAAEKAGVKLQIGFNRRFDPSFRRAHEVVAAGQIGQPHLLRITSRDPQPPPLEYIKVSGGIFLDMTIHDFDMARYLVGEVTEVQAVGAALIDPKIEEAGDLDTAVVTLRFENGAIGVIDNSRKSVYGYDQRAEVFGSQGLVTVSNRTPDATAISDTSGLHSPLPLFFFLERYLESYLAEMQEFITCILENKSPSVTGSDGRIAAVMGQAAWKSYRENKPVRLTEL